MDRETQTRPEILVRPASWPADQAAALLLLRRYADYLAAIPTGGPPIEIHGYDGERANLARTWAEPHGVLLLAFVAGEPAGCVAVNARIDGQCEMKRLWVETHLRGHSLGRTLVFAAMTWSRARNAPALLLDTLPAAMPEAGALYRSLGFVEVERHNDNPVAGLQFLRCDLPALP
ncbi:MAG: GNAT family N-acetyltransferase [Janthinobacterium lividum]